MASASAAAAAYPAEPFAQADSLMAGLIDSYRSSSDAADMADIQRMVETTVRIAQDREFRVAASIKGAPPGSCWRRLVLLGVPAAGVAGRSGQRAAAGASRATARRSPAARAHTNNRAAPPRRAELTQKAASAEASAVYSDAKAQHEARMADISSTIADVQQEVAQLSNDLR